MTTVTMVQVQKLVLLTMLPMRELPVLLPWGTMETSVFPHQQAQTVRFQSGRWMTETRSTGRTIYSQITAITALVWMMEMTTTGMN